MKNDLLAFFEEYKNRVNAYQLATSVLYLDQATIAPKRGSTYANKMMSILFGEQFEYATNPDNITKLELLEKQEGLSDKQKKELHLLLKNLEADRYVPKDVYVAFEKAVADSESIWQEAKHADNYEMFMPYLRDVIEKNKQVVSYSKKEKSTYDFLLDKFQEGYNIEKYDAFFHKIKEELVPFIKKLQNEAKQIDDAKLFEHYDIKKQEAFMEELKQYLLVDKSECYMATSEHPFTVFLSAHDVRITTHYYENNLMSAIFSTIHEYGHALYGLQVDDAFEGTTLQSNITYAMHESQSRFLENHIGRSRAFWEVNFPRLQAKFDTLKDVSLDEFVRMINVSRASLIRTEADELTYPLHILIRYELEKQIFNGEVDYEKLPEMWADKYEEYLGIRPSTYREGILQDMHWGAANHGYFPTYALGSAFAAQFYHQMEKEMDVEEVLRNGDFDKISDWLKENIHQYGAYKSADEIMLDVTNEPFNPDYYIHYLKEKYTKLYNL